MKSRRKLNAGYSQLRWVILLLVIAVILPTVCLLWFMTQAVKNERLAVRQKLVDIYEAKAKTVGEDLDTLWENERRHLESFGQLEPYAFFEVFAAARAPTRFEGFLIYDKNGKLAYPLLSRQLDVGPGTKLVESPWELEFVVKDFEQALAKYDEISKLASEPAIVFTRRMPMVRCLAKLNRTNEAIKLCSELAYGANSYLPAQIAHARLMLVNLYYKFNPENLLKELRRQLVNAEYDKELDYKPLQIPAETRIFVLNELINTAESSNLARQLKVEIEKSERTIKAEQISLASAELFATKDSFGSWPEKTIRRLDLPEPVYGVHYSIADKKVLALIGKEIFFSYLQDSITDMEDSTVVCRIYDNFGRLAAGTDEIKGRPFCTSSLSGALPEWKIELFFREPAVFESAASGKVALYTWGGILVIVLILLTGGFAGKVIVRQIKLNRLKNDFIATVTHELKTPLSSMRVLVDTLLEGNYEEERTANEYLQLISKENVRLSRLIDNFLTFSRMERNKQAFDIVKTDPAEIAKSAAEAVQTKFNEKNCKFSVTIDDNLPSIMADKDAMVTVLVNLLDNAYKYSYDEKRIILRVFAEDNLICFQVTDNGVGMSRRAARKIFTRFYQADRNLTRNVEGCGLGLSIVKFIVDAHKGSITVESRPGKGSTFTVQLPADKKVY